MTDKQFDAALAAAFEELSRESLQDVVTDESLDFVPSTRFRLRMRRLLHNPWRYLENLERPFWVKPLRAALLTVTAVTTVTVALTIPTVKAMDFSGGWVKNTAAYGPFHGTASCSAGATFATASTVGDGACTVELQVTGIALDGTEFTVTTTAAGDDSTTVTCSYPQALCVQAHAVHMAADGLTATSDDYCG